MEAPVSTASAGRLLACRRCVCGPSKFWRLAQAQHPLAGAVQESVMGSVPGQGRSEAVSGSGERWQPAASGGRDGV